MLREEDVPYDQSMGLSVAERLALLPKEDREEFIARQTPEILDEMVRGEWWYVSRPEQVPPTDGNWLLALALAGRGWGKSRASGEWLISQVVRHPYDRSGAPTEWLLIAETLADARTICIEGPAGILRILNRRRIEHRYKQSPRPMVLFPDGQKIYAEGADDADVGRGYNASGAVLDEVCVAEGEPVITDRGHVPVERVRVGDRVLTRDGWRWVVSAGLTATDATVLEIRTSTGTVRVTADHRVWTTRGWRRAGDLRSGDTVTECQPSWNQPTPKSLRTAPGTGRPGTTTRPGAITTTEKVNYFIGACGKQLMAPFRMVTRSITSITRDMTTGWRIWNFSPSPNIAGSLLFSARILRGQRGVVRDFRQDFVPTGCNENLNLWSATSAGRRSSASECEPSGVLEPVGGKRTYGSPVRVRSVSVLPGRRKVYDLTVAGGNPEFFAGAGRILVHNCKWIRPYESWWEGILPSLRADLIDDHPRAFVATTPKPIPIIMEWVASDDGSVHLMGGSTFDNKTNLSEFVLASLEKKYRGTAIGQQELYGKVLELATGGLFKRMDIVTHRVEKVPEDATIAYTVVGMDPNLTGEEAETGIVVVCRTTDGELYVLADRTIQGSGRQAALAAWRAVAEFNADLLVYEENLGKRFLEEVLRSAYSEYCDLDMFPQNTSPPMKGVHAKHGKKTRAEPVAMRSEQGRLHFVGHWPELEDQCVLYDPLSTRDSPDRMDAMVHAGIFLMSNEKKRMRIGKTSDLSLPRTFYELNQYGPEPTFL